MMKKISLFIDQVKDYIAHKYRLIKKEIEKFIARIKYFPYGKFFGYIKIMIKNIFKNKKK